MSSIKVTVTDSNNVNLTVNPRGSQTTAVSSNDIIVTVSPRGNQTVIIDRGVTSGGGGSGTVTQVTANTPLSVTNGTTTPDLSIAQATTSTAGYVSSTDWNTFNNKIGTITSSDNSITVTGTTTTDLVVNHTQNVYVYVRNATGATLTKGTVVYITGAIGQTPTISKAQANSDATSAQTLGVLTEDLANNTNGYITIIGLVTDVNTSAYADGQQLYLSPTVAGGMTAIKPQAPQHLVYVAIVEYAHAIHGKLFVKVQNGYELDELHDVQIISPANGQTLTYDSATSLWKNTTPTASGVTSVSGTGTVSGISLSGTVTSTGNITLGGSLNLSSPPAIGGNTPNTIVGTTINGSTITGGILLGGVVRSLSRFTVDDTASSGYTAELGVDANGYAVIGGASTVGGAIDQPILAPAGLALGDSNTALVTINAAPTASYGLNFPPAAGSNNQVLKTDGAGNLGWMDLGSPPAIGGTTPNTITGTTVSATTQIILPPVTVGQDGTGVLQMIDGLDGYDYLNIYTDDGFGSGYVAKFPYGLSTGTITGLINLSATGIISANYYEAGGGLIKLYGAFASTTLQASNATLTTQTFTLPSSTGSANQVLKTDGSGNLDWVNQGVQPTAPVTVTTATHSVATTTQWLIANRAGTVTLTLPTASSNTGRSLNVKTITANTVISNASNVVPLAGGAAGTAILAATAGKFATLVSDGTNWIIMSAG